MDKENVKAIYNNNRILFSLFLKKKEILAFVTTRMNLEGIMLSEPRGHYAKWNKQDRERQTLYGLTYMRNIKKPNS